MKSKKDIEELAGMVSALFEEKRGGFVPEDFIEVARELGFNLSSAPIRDEREDVEYTYYSKKQSGDGYWAAAPGAGDISEGMVWVAKHKKNEGR
jgi:hypothetical protein